MRALHSWVAVGAVVCGAACNPARSAPTATTAAGVTRPSDPLPSWNEGPAKRAVLDFVGKTTRRGPAFAAGNVGTGGDVAMLRFTKGRAGPSLSLVVRHDDAVRGAAHDGADGATLRAAQDAGVVVVSMRADGNAVFDE